MRYHALILSIVGVLTLFPKPVPAQSAPAGRQRLDLNADWRFIKSDAPDGNQLAYPAIKANVLQTGARFLHSSDELPPAELGPFHLRSRTSMTATGGQ